MESLSGRLLIAAPSLSDFFHRTVVLVIEHNEEGALGVVLNRPSQTPVDEAVPPLASLSGPDDVVHVGGPVSSESVLALGEFADPGQASRIVVGDLGLVDPDLLEADVNAMRVYAGYAGWAPDQLEAEVESEGWIVVDALPGDPFHEGDLWADALTRKGGAYAFLATMPADPSLN